MPHRDFLRLLSALYPPREADSCARALVLRIERFLSERIPHPTSGNNASLSERDALLITYADQLRDADAPPLVTFGAFARRHLAGVVSGIHLLPFYPWSSDDGFSVKDHHAVDPSCGNWTDIAGLGRSFDLMFDAVLNHMSAQSAWFDAFLAGAPAYRDFFVEIKGSPDLSAVIRPRALPLLTEFPAIEGRRKLWTTFSADQVDLNYANPAVLLASVDVLLDYVARGAHFIRLDAVAFLWKEIGTDCLHRPQTHAIVRLWRAVLEKAAPHVRLITETNVPHDDNIRYFGDGTNEAHLVYNFALPPLVLHALQTGNSAALSAWAASLSTPSRETSFFNFLASHDGIGLNPVRGILSSGEIDALVARTLERGGFISQKQLPDGSEAPYEMNINYLDALTPREEPDEELSLRRFVAAHAIMFSLRGVPGIYFHSLFGSRGDTEAVRTTGIKRRVNREKLARTALEAALADPVSRRARVFGALRGLLAQRRAHPAFSPSAPQQTLDLGPQIFALLRGGEDERGRVLCLHNLSSKSIAVDPAGAGFAKYELGPYEVRWLPQAG